jgi:hypothetical protein
LSSLVGAGQGWRVIVGGVPDARHQFARRVQFIAQLVVVCNQLDQGFVCCSVEQVGNCGFESLARASVRHDHTFPLESDSSRATARDTRSLASSLLTAQIWAISS